MRRFSLLFFLFASLSSYSQTKDALLWTGIGLDYNLSKKISFKYETQLRLDKNISSLKTYYNELSANYEPIKYFKVGGTYRYSRQNKTEHYENSHRICINTSYTVPLKELNLRFKLRARYQFKFDRLTQINNTIYPDFGNMFRLKFNVKYKNDAFKRIQPYAFYELFKSLDNDNYTEGRLSAYRIGLGLDFDLPKRQEISVKYIYEGENSSVPSISHIYLVQYNYTLKSKSSKRN